MAASDEELAFYRAVEDFFAAARGVPHVLSPSDFQLLRSWWREGVPLTAVTTGVSEVLARKRDRGDDDPVVSLTYCRHAVARQAKRLAEMHTGLQEGTTDASDTSLRRTPADIADALRSAASALTPELAAAAPIILKIADEVDAGAELPQAVLEERLFALESVLLSGCWRALAGPERDRIEALARDTAVASGATGDALDRTRRAIRDRELRKRLQLPRLELG